MGYFIIGPHGPGTEELASAFQGGREIGQKHPLETIVKEAHEAPEPGRAEAGGR